MHELSIASAIVGTVAEATDGARVESVTVTVGALSGVVPSALEFCWDVATAGTALTGSRLVIDHVPTAVFCTPCAAVVQPDVGFACPTCGQLSGDLRAGRELEIRSACVLDPAGATSP